MRVNHLVASRTSMASSRCRPRDAEHIGFPSIDKGVSRGPRHTQKYASARAPRDNMPSRGHRRRTFLQALLNGGALHGARILRPETVAMMMQNQIGELNVQEMRSAQPSYSRSFDQPVLRYQHAAGTEWALRRQHLLGRTAQLLARPGEARHRRALLPGLALLRRVGRRAVRRFRARSYAGLA